MQPVATWFVAAHHQDSCVPYETLPDYTALTEGKWLVEAREPGVAYGFRVIFPSEDAKPYAMCGRSRPRQRRVGAGAHTARLERT